MLKLLNSQTLYQLNRANIKNLFNAASQVSRRLISVGCSRLGAQNETKHQENVKMINELVRRIRAYEDIDLNAAELDWNYILDRKNLETINKNIHNRKGVGDTSTLFKYYDDFERALSNEPLNDSEIENLVEKMYYKAVDLPNTNHELIPVGDYDKAVCVHEYGTKKAKTPTIDKIANLYGWLKEEHITLFSTQRAYILKRELADLEVALVRYTLKYLAEKGFIHVNVPDILHHSIIESCGFPTKGERNQVYKLDYLNEYGKYCLSGTSEMSLAGLLKNQLFNRDELPLKFCSTSRCYRAEVSGSEREGKLYRLHEFTKVEMFVITLGETATSNSMLEYIKNIQMELFSDLGFNFRVLDMPTEELGAPAFRKYDIESWMPGNQFYGEISSTSNCTDYQSRRLNIKSTKNKADHSEPKEFVHTLNGTACAIPRMLTTIVESNWDMEKRAVKIPEKLRSYFRGKEYFEIPKHIKKAKPFKVSK